MKRYFIYRGGLHPHRKVGTDFSSIILSRYYRVFIFAVIILLNISALVISGNGLDDVNPHHFQMSCANCHEAVTDEYGVESIGVLRGNINQLCSLSGCHEFDPYLNHPVGVVFTGTVPNDLPLDEHSKITCLTCHTEQNISSDDIFGNKNLLRRPAGVQLCYSCHYENSQNLLEQSHWRFSTRAHLSSIKPPSFTDNDEIRFVGGIDIESRTCLSCHEEVTLTIPDDHETSTQRRVRWQRMSDHPIGMDYGIKSIAPSAKFNYPLMDKRIRLFNGRLGCGSCHSLYAQTRKNLVARYEMGVLCRKCHNL